MIKYYYPKNKCIICGKDLHCWKSKTNKCLICFNKNSNRKHYKYILNEKVFNKLNPISIYWIGYLAGDGCVTNNKFNNSIELVSKDKEHLNKFKKFLNYNGKIYKNKSNNYIIYIYSKKLVNDLKKFNIIPNKTNQFYMNNIPEKFERYFWRGFFDADGHITQDKNIVKIGICGTLKLCNQFKNFINKEFLITGKRDKKITINSQCKQLYELCYTGFVAKQILYYFYNKSKIYLKRKYQKAMEFLNKSLNNLTHYEQRCYTLFEHRLAGVDSVNIFSYELPIYVAMIIPKTTKPNLNIKDSKLLTDNQIKKIAPKLMKSCEWAIEKVDIAQCNKAHLIGEYHAIKKLSKKLKPKGIIIDYHSIPELQDIWQIGLLGADRICWSVACASILARYFYLKDYEKYIEKYPEYKNSCKGTLIRRCIEPIFEYGYLPKYHRIRWIKSALKTMKIRRYIRKRLDR